MKVDSSSPLTFLCLANVLFINVEVAGFVTAQPHQMPKNQENTDKHSGSLKSLKVFKLDFKNVRP